jgi:hypothetical protein
MYTTYILGICIEILIFDVDWNEGSEPRHWFYVYSQRFTTTRTPFLTVTDHTKYSMRCTRYNIMLNIPTTLAGADVLVLFPNISTIQ